MLPGLPVGELASRNVFDGLLIREQSSKQSSPEKLLILVIKTIVPRHIHLSLIIELSQTSCKHQTNLPGLDLSKLSSYLVWMVSCLVDTNDMCQSYALRLPSASLSENPPFQLIMSIFRDSLWTISCGIIDRVIFISISSTFDKLLELWGDQPALQLRPQL